MPKLTSLYSTATALSLPLILAASMAMAQSTETEEPADEPAQETPGPADGLSLGEEATEGPKVGETYVKETYGDWSMRCIKTEEGEDPCQMYQLLADDEGTPISEFTLFRLPDGGQARAGATVIVPLETSLAAQLTVKIDSNPAKRYPFAFCNSIGCYARIGLTQQDIDGFKKGNQAVLTIVPVLAPDQKVDVSLSLTGFTAAYDNVSVIEQ
ncbi:invasion associated locus B family protein [Roseobacter sp.]|uniref:invasion associated locus B family protein n=1 Tax=Roseobacter sp. TaxID=1907202 RepID=UPI002965FA65|nr:invasion associated locus B family protein [Roseobacter sp.]MDW3184275.1 invasion associated locus B family protein [Roseobacter sp.]